MATTNVVNTTLFTFRGGAAGATAVSLQRDVTWTINMEPRDITTKDAAGYRRLLEGLRQYSLSISGLVAFDATLGPFTTSTGIEALIRARTQQTWIMGTGVSGDVKLSGAGYWTSLEVSSPTQEDNLTFNGTLEGDGQWYVGTF